MKITIGKDNKRLLFEKYFSDEEILSATCLNMKVLEQTKVVCDIRVVCKDALLLFVSESDRNLMRNKMNKKERDDFVSKVNALYKQDAIEFVEKFSPGKLYEDIGRKLNPYQSKTLWESRNRQFNLYALEQGLGKTVTSASASKMFGLKRTVVVCPSLVKWNWYIDLTKEWGFNSLTFSVLDRDKPMQSIIQENFCIVNYESVDKFFDRICQGGIDHLIIDEAHYVKNSSTNKFKQVKRLLDEFPKARVTFLTGTPIKNRITDLFALLRLSHHPMGKNFMEFKRRYAKGKQKVTGVKNVEDLRLKMSNWMIRKKSEEELDLPELNINRYYFAMDSKSKQEYDLVMQEMYEQEKVTSQVEVELTQLKKDIKEGRISKDEMKGANMELQRLTLLYKKGTMSKKGNIMTLNRVCAESKIDDIIKLIKNYNKEGEKVVVFSFFNTVLEKLRFAFESSSVLINGSVSALKRRDYIEKFKKDDKCKVFLGQVIAAGIGINLVNANKAIFTDLSFTPDLLEQPYKRLHRQGQKNDVEVIYTMVPDSIDERIYALIEGKSNDINTVIDHGKKGNIEYSNLEKKLFNSLIEDFEKKHNIQNSIIPKMTKVK